MIYLTLSARLVLVPYLHCDETYQRKCLLNVLYFNVYLNVISAISSNKMQQGKASPASFDGKG